MSEICPIDFDLIVTIVNRGFAEEVMTAAKAAVIASGKSELRVFIDEMKSDHEAWGDLITQSDLTQKLHEAVGTIRSPMYSDPQMTAAMKHALRDAGVEQLRDAKGAPRRFKTAAYTEKIWTFRNAAKWQAATHYEVVEALKATDAARLTARCAELAESEGVEALM